MDFQFKMVEEKDMCSSPSVRAPKLQLAVERPLTEDFGSHQKKKKKNALCPKTKKKLQQDGRMGTNTIKSNPIHANVLVDVFLGICCLLLCALQL